MGAVPYQAIGAMGAVGAIGAICRAIGAGVCRIGCNSLMVGCCDLFVFSLLDRAIDDDREIRHAAGAVTAEWL